MHSILWPTTERCKPKWTHVQTKRLVVVRICFFFVISLPFICLILSCCRKVFFSCSFARFLHSPELQYVQFHFIFWFKASVRSIYVYWLFLFNYQFLHAHFPLFILTKPCPFVQSCRVFYFHSHSLRYHFSHFSWCQRTHRRIDCCDVHCMNEYISIKTYYRNVFGQMVNSLQQHQIQSCSPLIVAVIKLDWFMFCSSSYTEAMFSNVDKNNHFFVLNLSPSSKPW